MNKFFEETKSFLKYHCLSKCGHNANESCICKILLCFKELEQVERILNKGGNK